VRPYRRFSISVCRWSPSTRNAIIAAGALGFGFAVLYLRYRSQTLDDFDSVSFSLALHDFDLQQQQPQPPGFPVYVVLARALAAFEPDPVVALTTLSALGGAMAVMATLCSG
jgi:hypothetical protein